MKYWTFEESESFMFYYALIENGTGICYELYESETEIDNPNYVQIESYDESYVIRKKYVNGQWVDTTIDEAMQYNGYHVGIRGKWLDEVLDDMDSNSVSSSDVYGKAESDAKYAAASHIHPEYIESPSTAAIGQVIKVSNVDEFGKPIAWDTMSLYDPGIQIATSEGNGSAYTVSVYGINSLTAGESFILIPHTMSTSVVPTLNVNGLGAKTIRRPISTNTATTVPSTDANWLAAGKPIQMTYNGVYWVANLARPYASDIYGTVSVNNGGVPACTTADNGKVLKVVDGVPTWVTEM